MEQQLPMPTQWHEKYKVGIAEIDQQHMDLLRHVETIHAMLAHPKLTKTSIRATMREFAEHVKFHFKFEEDLMFYFNFNDYSTHKETHKFLLMQLKKLVEENGDQVSGARRIANFLQSWLVGHISVDDFVYAKQFNQIAGEEYQLFLEHRQGRRDSEGRPATLDDV
ncbi:MAG: bacteriohemerythrin [Magnetococcales bacterium]|nr:bacteriohemerythrin [Magnetococcales bacterium]